ncbi:GAF domain-containing protein [Streptomyces pratensis]|uniref:GAF domain-containing protein n=1 Tax=Streptomyces pratensis TaxID=1169025 RepID=UPI00379984C9
MSTQQVARAFVSLADTFDDTVDPAVLMQRLVAHCVTFTDSDAAGLLMVAARGELRPVAVSDDRDDLLETMRRQAVAGPCVECWLTGLPVQVDDLTSYAGAQPEVVRSALQAGHHAMHAHPVQVGHQTIGVLVLLRADAGPFDADGLHLAAAFAEVTAVALMQWRAQPLLAHDIVTRTQSVISARATLETAKGMLAAHARLTRAQATAVLAGYAREQGLRPGTVAHRLLSRTLPLDEVTGTEAPAAE